MAKVRSPNYPNIPLSAALESVRPVYKKEHLNKMSRAVLGKHLGYSSLNGRALTKIGAVRAYGLVDGSGDELRISEDAVHALNAPKGSDELTAALVRLALRPELFADIRKQYPHTHPSAENLAYWLTTKNFTPDAAAKAAQSYLTTMALVEGKPEAYTSTDEAGEKPVEPTPESAQQHRTMKAETGRFGLSGNPTRGGAAPFRVEQIGNLISIEARGLDLNGLKKLKQMIETYETLLQMFSDDPAHQQ